MLIIINTKLDIVKTKISIDLLEIFFLMMIILKYIKTLNLNLIIKNSCNTEMEK